MQPDATLLLLSCQHAHFVEAAIGSLLAQRDVRLQILLSDDASTDGSWEIIQRLAARYRGPHLVEARRNAVRMGVTGHLNGLLPAVASNLVILAASDDISTPYRAKRLVESWRTAGMPRSYLTSDARFLYDLDQVGDLLRANPPARSSTLADLVNLKGGNVLGCTGAFHRDVWSVFGPITVSRQVEDRPLAFRAAALDGVLHVEEPLVNYRVHGTNLSQSQNVPSYADAPRRRQCDFEAQIFGQFLVDLKHAQFSARHGSAAVAMACKAAQIGYQQAQVSLEYLAAQGWRKGGVLAQAILRGESPRRLLGWSWETLTRAWRTTPDGRAPDQPPPPNPR